MTETIQEQMSFNLWWESADNPCASMLETTKDQMKPFMRQAWNAGRKAGANRKYGKLGSRTASKHERFEL